MDQALAEKLKNYKPSPVAVQLIKTTPILLLVGPSGAGKDSVKDKLLEDGKFHHIISHTTRHPRINQGVPEQDGLEYHFIDIVTAEKMLDEQLFIEAKIYSDNLYGTSLAEIQAAHDENKIAMTDIEVQGVAEYKALDPNVMALFILPPDFQTWQVRLTQRYGDIIDVKDQKLRMQTALKELEQLLNTDYYIAVINNVLSDTIQHVETIIKSENHNSPDEPKARNVATQLAQDIKTYLAAAT